MRRGYLVKAVRAISRSGMRLRWLDRDGCRPDLRELFAGLLFDRVLDLADDLLRLLVAPVDEEPARALGHVAADEQDADAEHGADPEGEPPADVRGEERGVEQGDRGNRADRRRRPSSCR